MPCVQYISKRFKSASQWIINNANIIIAEYAEKGYRLTLRQLYYQFVARGLIPNKQSEYKKLGEIISDGRLAGLIGWLAIEDRTRYLRRNQHWESPSQVIEACAEQFMIDRWKDQDYRIEVWIEKDALVGVIEGVCTELDVPYFSCRGYNSQSEMWKAGMRTVAYDKDGKHTIFLHLGDHDPSGLDMTRDLEDRLDLLSGGLFSADKATIERIALNMNQIEELKPPPNPTKITDSRAKGYIQEYGMESWELDALEPEHIVDLIKGNVWKYRDQEKWNAAKRREFRMIETIKALVWLAEGESE